MQKELNKAVEAISDLVEVWDNDKVKYYPSTLMSFDELACEISQIELNPNSIMDKLQQKLFFLNKLYAELEDTIKETKKEKAKELITEIIKLELLLEKE